MIKNFIRYLRQQRAMQRITLALARGAAASSLRIIDPLNPASWEFSGFSQNGEDGIIEYLAGKIGNPNRYFIEIGSSDGIENNSAWLAIAKKHSGIMVEADNKRSAFSKEIMRELNLGVDCLNLFVSMDNVDGLAKMSLYKNPDLMSIDIDGNDYYIAKGLMELGLRPKIFVVEYNSVYGPSNSCTIKYEEDFSFQNAHDSQLFFGVSITGWKIFFDYYNYKFITVDNNGVNAFFVDKNEFDGNYLNHIKGSDFIENYYLKIKYRVPWDIQFNMIKEMEFVEIK